MPTFQIHSASTTGRVVATIDAKNSRLALRAYAAQAGHTCWTVKSATRLYVEGVGDYFATAL